MQRWSPLLTIAVSAVVLLGLGYLGYVLISNQISSRDRDFLNQLTERQQSLTDVQGAQRRLADSLSISTTPIVLPAPTGFDRLFNTQLQQQYEALYQSIPAAIRADLDRLNLERNVREVYHSSILLRGDSSAFQSRLGIQAPWGKIVPYGSWQDCPDSMLVVLSPQRIRISGVRVQPRPQVNQFQLYLSAYNETTGDSLYVESFANYQFAQRATKRWFIKQLAVGADFRGSPFVSAGVIPFSLQRPRANYRFGETSLQYFPLSDQQIRGQVSLFKIEF